MTLLLSKPRFLSGTAPHRAALGFLESALEKWGLAWSTRLIANSEGSREAWIRRYGRRARRIQVLPNHVEDPPFDKVEQRKRLRREFGLKPDAFVITTSGLLERQKNFEVLIRALAEASHPRAVLLLLGDGSRRKALEQLAQTLKVETQTIFTGWREDVRRLVQGSDLFVFPSFREGMSESLLEAATCRVPCLVSAIPENMEVIRNAEQQFPPDRPGCLAEKIRRVIDDREFYDQLLFSTLKEKDRYVFDWPGAMIRETERLLAGARR